ncbi:MAG: hypothetical protein H6652_19465 [Ardenticatenaceae bacterium]|nr:hypothetical protein [Ardenticatenaceae bacterium]
MGRVVRVERPFTFSWLRNGRSHPTYAKIRAFQMTKQAARRDADAAAG